MSGKRINILIYHLDQGGVEKTAVNLANELAKLGNDVTLTTIYKQYPQKFNIDNRIQLKNIVGFYFKGLDRLVKQLPKPLLYKHFSNEDYDIEIAFQADLPTEIIGASTNKNSKKYAWLHGIGFKYTDAYEKFDKIFIVGQELRGYYKNKFPNVAVEKMKVFHNAINVEEIYLQARVNDLHYNDDQLNIISVGRLSKEKRFDRLLKSISLVSDQYKNKMHLRIVGEGSERSYLEQLIKELHLEDKVTLEGFQSNPYKYIKRSDLYICSSDYEGFNVALIEAALLEIPIITTDVFGSRELITNDCYYGKVVSKDEYIIAKEIEKFFKYRASERNENPIKKNILKLIDSRKSMMDKYFK